MDDHNGIEELDAVEYYTEIRAVNEKLVISAVQQQELAESALRTEQRLRDIIDSLGVVICEVEVSSGRSTFLSLRSDTFLGRSVELWLDSPAFLKEIVHPSDRERAFSLIPTEFDGGLNYEYDFRAISDDETFIYMRNIIRGALSSEGNKKLLRCVIVDVTEKKNIERALEHLYIQEKTVTEALHRSILFIPPEDSFPGIKVNRIYEAASDISLVGGDFFDTFACDHGHVALIVGDVTGHGLAAGLFTTELRFALRGFVQEHIEPSAVLGRMNAYLVEKARLHREGLCNEGSDSPLSVSIAIIDTSTGKGLISSAGMEPALVVRRGGGVEEIDVSGLLLGIQPNEPYDQAEFTLSPGDTLVQVTDGITEARNDGSYLGLGGLKQLALLGSSKDTLEEMGRTILNGSRDFAGGLCRDDACILLARRV